MQHEAATAPRPFWHRINTFFAFPLQTEPLTYGTLLAMSSLLFKLVFFLPDFLAILLIEVGIMLASSRYGFKVTALGSRGISRAADFPRELDDEWTHLPWKLFVILVVQGFALGWLSYVSPLLATLGIFVMSFTLPATVMLLVQTGSIAESLKPAALWDTIRIIGWPYALLCFFLFLLSTGAQVAIGLLLPLFSGLILLPLINLALIYFSWVMASLLGYTMYQHHAAFGVDLLPGGGDDGDGAAPDRRSPEQIAQQETDAQVARMITDGDVAGALGMAYEDQRTRPDELAAQRRYHRVLLLANKSASLTDHAQRFMALLVRRGQPSEALQVYKACRKQDAGFVVGDAPTNLALANAEWRAGDARAALALISGFDKRFRGHDSVPQAYELAARALVQGLGRADMAQQILKTLESRYPDSEPTQEVRWLLRNAPATTAVAASS
ncbi:tol-pal system YbgF family protein [Acidovorax sp. Leaf78]|uniref:tetratricopeptide repeat protein n=1 Tax=unclassified Acidovorax TaxID=2684926 RepID=UPI0006F94479|nr:hypothetical protein [Acidovorax sp. Leaf78]KQO27675.1 hypothetical protein ASF16_02260 [Acidovorax sp. Leaf78]